jgi:protein-tyrosine phosphatase
LVSSSNFDLREFSYAGISRSSSCVIAYLMKEKGFNFLDALQYSRNKRNCVFPNIGFQA